MPYEGWRHQFWAGCCTTSDCWQPWLPCRRCTYSRCGIRRCRAWASGDRGLVPHVMAEATIASALLRGLRDAVAVRAVVQHQLVGALQPVVRVRVEGAVLDDALVRPIDHAIDEFGVHAAVSVLSHQGVQSRMLDVSMVFRGGFWKCLPSYSSPKGVSPPQGSRGGRVGVPIVRRYPARFCRPACLARS